MTHLVWFRNDLRIEDNTALFRACEKNTTGTVALYLICKAEWQSHFISACRVDFILKNLAVLQKDLAALQIPLKLKIVEKTSEVVPEIIKCCEQNKIETIFFNREYEWDELQRDAALIVAASSKKITVFPQEDLLIIPPGKIKTKEGNFYTIYTPFKNAWIRFFLDQVSLKRFAKPALQKKIAIESDTIPLHFPEYNNVVDMMRWEVGEKKAQQRLQNFANQAIFDYDKNRDFPAKQGTSQLSPYLASGILSARDCLRMALEQNQGELVSGNKGIQIWINELIWREFYKNIVVGFPHVCKNKPFKLQYEKIPWKNNPSDFEAWSQGQTGFPIIDSAMRQLNQTGWMHNRLRMIVAMFLSKNLLIDWRWGERYFMQHLIDGDFAANNGGWQWSASTGTDAAPYFRIFNPTAQSQKCDPEGVFIKRYCPELSRLDAKTIHEPWTSKEFVDYPKPLVDLSRSRQEAIEVFKRALVLAK